MFMPGRRMASAAWGRLAVVLIGAAALFGCAGVSNGSNFPAVVHNAGAPAAGMSRVVLYPTRDADATTLQLDGVLVGRLKPGTFTYRDVPAGGHELVAEPPAMGRLERYAFGTSVGQTYYLKVDATDFAKWNHEAAGASALGGAAGPYMIRPRPEDGTSLFKFVNVNAATAARELADMILLSN
jgi:hypothetical protein